MRRIEDHERKPDQQAGYKAAQVAHIVNSSTHEAALAQHEIDTHEENHAARNGPLFSRRNREIAKFHTGQQRAGNSEDRSRGSYFEPIRI